jgi:hypothetical protein
MPPHLGRVLSIVVSVLVLVTALIVGLGTLLPREWHVEQSILINASAPAVHAWVADLRNWPRWAQWNQTELRPHDQVSEPSAGVGATLHWYGRADRAGEGSTGEVRITRSDPHAGVWFENRTGDGPPSQAVLTYVEHPGVTLVTWQDRGLLPRIVGGLFRDQFQKNLAAHMETGLERLKDLVEHRAPENTTGEASAPSRDAGPPAPPPAWSQRGESSPPTH